MICTCVYTFLQVLYCTHKFDGWLFHDQWKSFVGGFLLIVTSIQRPSRWICCWFCRISYAIAKQIEDMELAILSIPVTTIDGDEYDQRFTLTVFPLLFLLLRIELFRFKVIYIWYFMWYCIATTVILLTLSISIFCVSVCVCALSFFPSYVQYILLSSFVYFFFPHLPNCWIWVHPTFVTSFHFC